MKIYAGGDDKLQFKFAPPYVNCQSKGHSSDCPPRLVRGFSVFVEHHAP